MSAPYFPNEIMYCSSCIQLNLPPLTELLSVPASTAPGASWSICNIAFGGITWARAFADETTGYIILCSNPESTLAEHVDDWVRLLPGSQDTIRALRVNEGDLGSELPVT